jgi:peptidoglycan/xylan/chitin deacetylase (PgdA/CDA1 family)
MVVLNFHRVESPTGLELTRVSPARFARILDLVGSLEEQPSGLGQTPIGLRGRTVFTFDDGFASVAESAVPLLRERGWNAIVFLITGAMGGSDDWDVRVLGRRRPMMSWAQVKSAAEQGFEFGSHTCRHRDLTVLSARALAAEVEDSKRRIEDTLGREVRHFSYPFGRFNERVVEAVRRAGYQAAFALGLAHPSVAGEYAIPRVNVHALTTLYQLRRVLAGGNIPWTTRFFSSLSAGSATVGNWGGN